MSPIDINDDDVVSMPPDKNFVSCPTNKISEIKRVMLTKWVTPQHQQWFTDGTPCQILFTEGGGWREGKLIFRLEFIPDELHNQSTQ